MSLTDSVFCCTCVDPSEQPGTAKPHHDPNRDKHAEIYESFMTFAARRGRSTMLLSLIQTKPSASLASTDLIESAITSAGPSGGNLKRSPQLGHKQGYSGGVTTPVSFSLQNSKPSAEALVSFQVDSNEDIGWGIFPAARTPTSRDKLMSQSVPFVTLENLAKNPLTEKTFYVMHLTCRHDFGPVISHRYFACPASLDQDWQEMSLAHWFAMGGIFQLKAEKWDLKCTDHSKFFRISLRPNLRYRGVGIWSREEKQGSM